MTTAYVIADVKVSDPDQYRHYTALTPAAVAAAGGEFIVRGADVVESLITDGLERTQTRYNS
jgi:uncharacterized protein (DUF1330 family)